MSSSTCIDLYIGKRKRNDKTIMCISKVLLCIIMIVQLLQSCLIMKTVICDITNVLFDHVLRVNVSALLIHVPKTLELSKFVRTNLLRNMDVSYYISLLLVLQIPTRTPNSSKQSFSTLKKRFSEKNQGTGERHNAWGIWRTWKQCFNLSLSA